MADVMSLLRDWLLGANTTTPTVSTSISQATPGTTNKVVASVDQTTPGTTNLIESRPSARRNAGVLHRNAVAAVDVLAVPAAATLATAGTGGHLADSTTFYVTYAAYNRWGATTVPTPASQETGAPGTGVNTITATLAQVTGADGYDIFCSVDAAPLWVGRITETQRATGGFQIQAVGTVTAGGGNAAGTVLIAIAGTGVASTANPFAVNNAYTPASVTAINCAGRTVAHVLVKLAVTDLRSLPTLTLTPFFANQVSGTDWHEGSAQAITLLTAVSQPLEQAYTINVNGSTGLAILVQAITGQGAAVSVWVELA